jgi:hypothetical protein
MFPINTISFMEDYIKCGVLSTIYLYFTQKKCPPYKKNYVCQSCKVVSKHKSKFANITDLISVSTSGEQDKQKIRLWSMQKNPGMKECVMLFPTV